MAPIKCEIILNKRSRIYFPSEIVQGTVNICTKAATNISKMELSLLAQGKFGTDNDKFPVYFEKKSLSLNKILPSGIERFPITWTLPWGIISSFKWKPGSISYHFVVKIGVKTRGGSLIKRRDSEEMVTSAPAPIEIYNYIDLNKVHPRVRRAEEYNTTLRLSTYPEASIFLRFVINRRCFVPGEHVNFNCAVRIDGAQHGGDDTGGKVQKKVFRGILITMDEEISYFKDGQDKTIVTNVLRETGGSAVIQIKRGQSESGATTTAIWEDSVKIPNYCNSTLEEFDSSGIVRVCYFLNVCLNEESRIYADHFIPIEPQFRIPIVIGAIPLEEPLRCEMEMALITSRQLIPWNDNDDDESEWEQDQYMDPQHPSLPPSPVPMYSRYAEDDHPETPPPSYLDAVGVMETASGESPPEYTP